MAENALRFERRLWLPARQGEPRAEQTCLMAHLVRVKYLADTRKAGPGNKLTARTGSAPIDYMHRYGPVPAGGLSWQTTLVSLSVCVSVCVCIGV